MITALSLFVYAPAKEDWTLGVLPVLTNPFQRPL
jgi:hypothetical protein